LEKPTSEETTKKP